MQLFEGRWEGRRKKGPNLQEQCTASHLYHFTPKVLQWGYTGESSGNMS